MTPQEIDELINKVATRVAAEVGEQVASKLSVLGLNVDQPEQQRADFDHLRRWRSNAEAIGRSGVTAVVMSLIGAVMTVLYYGIQAVVSLPKK